MEEYGIPPWLVWGIVTVLLMMGAWMRLGVYLFYLGVAALLALGEAIYGVSLRWQIVSFVAASSILSLCYWYLGGRAARARSKGSEKEDAATERRDDQVGKK